MREASTLLGCGKCGYPVRGISELKCPECGADLTEAGIIRGGNARDKFVAFLPSLAYTLALVVVAFIALQIVKMMLPVYSEAYYSIQIVPISGEYKEIGLHINAELIQPASKNPGVNVTVSPGSGPMTSVTMCAPGTQIDVYDVDLFLKFNAFNDQLGSTEVAISIDPDTRQLTWYQTPTVWHQTPAAFTDQDLLTAFDAYGFDISRPDVQLEAKQLYTFITDFMNGQHQLTLSAFNSLAYGGATNLSSGPPRFISLYIGSWFVAWLIGLVLLIRKAHKRAWGRPKQK
jgi:hypothetical protein